MESTHSWMATARRCAIGFMSVWIAACGSSKVGNGGAGGSALAGGASGSLGGAPGTGGPPGAGGAMGAAGSGGSGSGGAVTTGSGGRGQGGADAGATGPDAATGTGACPAMATARPGDMTETITAGGMQRTFLRHIPNGYTGRTPAPVVFDFHGLSGTGMQQSNLSGFRNVADQKGFIMVWPNGVDNSWNVGRCCGTAQSQNIDDVGFVRAIIATLAQEACIDTKRVYATGCSNGGGMSYKLACDAADVIAAVAPVDFDCVTATTGAAACGNCRPARPITEIQFRATGDQLVSYTGDNAFPGAQQNLTTWGQINMCTGATQALPENAGCQEFPMCGAGVESVLCTIQGGSHCGNYRTFDIANVAWTQLAKFALP